MTRFVWRGLLVALVFVGVGLLTARAVKARAAGKSTPAAQVQLASAMAGLFAGGAAGSALLLVLAFGRR